MAEEVAQKTVKFCTDGTFVSGVVILLRNSLELVFVLEREAV
jgi:hypothetical protein